MATQRLQIYRCNRCGNMVELVHTGAGRLVCCNEPMELLTENTQDAALEKHVPVIEEAEGVYTVKVGSVPHPMGEEHLIEWIELIADGKAYRHFLKAGDAPEARFHIKASSVTAREYCNLHGLWRNQ